MTPKEKLAQALFTLKFLDLWLDHTTPAATLHFQNTILSENYTPGQMIADNTPVWWENAITIGVRALDLRKDKVMLVISDDGQHHWVPGRHVKERKEEDIVWHQPSRRATSDGENKTDDQQPPQTGSKDQQSQTTHLGSTEEIDHWRGRIGQRTGTAFDFGYLVPGCIICGNHHIWQPITKKVEGQDMEAT